jgi:molybdenum cofactor biosynthesis protein B
MSQVSAEFIPTRIAILTVSDRRGEEDDTSGHWLREAAQEAGHHIVDKAIVKENRYAIRAQVSQWIASDEVQVVLITGGTGLPQAIRRRKRCSRCLTARWKALAKCSACSPLKRLAPPRCSPARCRGGEQHADFRHAGLDQSLPHRVGNIIAPQLDARTRPCNFHPHLKK